MHKKRELCRNFQRGSCQYGERCKFLHALQQQQKSDVPGFGPHTSSHQKQIANPFGFGSHAGSLQQHKTNPFGFGMQNSSQSTLSADLEFKQHQFKPFENKWTRPSSSPQGVASRKTDGGSQPVNHKCTDPEICKRQIAEDFEQEKPIWTLTCYSHCKCAPCDIVGDISYEELRAAAYEDAKHGMILQAIVEKERSLLSSKVVEFQNLLRQPYTVPLNSSATTPNYESLSTNANPFSRTTQNSDPLSVSSFSQLGASLKMCIERPSAPPKDNAAQLSSFETEGYPLTSNMTPNQQRDIAGGQMSLYSASAELAKFPSAAAQQSYIPCNGSSSGKMFPESTDAQLLNNSIVDHVSGDSSIWLQEKWIPGEIPEESPPDTFIR